MLASGVIWYHLSGPGKLVEEKQGLVTRGIGALLRLLSLGICPALGETGQSTGALGLCHRSWGLRQATFARHSFVTHDLSGGYRHCDERR